MSSGHIIETARNKMNHDLYNFDENNTFLLKYL